MGYALGRPFNMAVVEPRVSVHMLQPSPCSAKTDLMTFRLDERMGVAPGWLAAGPTASPAVCCPAAQGARPFLAPPSSRGQLVT